MLEILNVDTAEMRHRSVLERLAKMRFRSGKLSTVIEPIFDAFRPYAASTYRMPLRRTIVGGFVAALMDALKGEGG